MDGGRGIHGREIRPVGRMMPDADRGTAPFIGHYILYASCNFQVKCRRPLLQVGARRREAWDARVKPGHDENGHCVSGWGAPSSIYDDKERSTMTKSAE